MDNLNSLVSESYIENTFGDRYLYSVNRAAFNQTGSRGVFDSFFKHSLFLDDMLYVILGTDSGLFIDYIASSEIGQACQYVFVELDVLHDKVQSKERPELPDNIQVVTLAQWRARAEADEYFRYLVREKVKMVRSIGALDGYLSEYTTLYQDANQILMQQAWKAKAALFAEQFIKQTLRNLPENRVGTEILRNQFKDQHAVILGGGPSLDEHLEWVKAHREQLLVVSVSRISKRLQEVDITPDIIVCIDPTDKMYLVSEGVFDFSQQALLVHANYATSLIVGAWEGRHMYLGNRIIWDPGQDANNIFVKSPTVTNTALHLLIEMGVSNIYLAGVDLCFSQQGYTHAKGSAEFDSGPQLGFMGQKVMTNAGELAETDQAFFEAISILSEQACEARERDIAITNLSHQAAQLEGVAYQPSDAITLTQKCLASEKVNALYKVADAESMLIPFYQSSLQALYQGQAALKTIISNFTEIMRLNDQLDASDKKSVVLRKINRLEKQTTNRFELLLNVLRLQGQKNFKDIFHERYQQCDEMQTVQSGTHICANAYVETAKVLLKSMQEAIARMECRIDECSETPDVEHLIAQWQGDGLYERALKWRDKHQARISQEQLSLFAACERKAAQLRDNIQAENKSVTSPIVKLKQVSAKMLMLYKAQEFDRLSLLVQTLAKSNQECAEHQAMAYLGCGYVAELAGEDDEAIAHYHRATQSSLTMEIALNNLAGLLLRNKDYANAELTLACLSDLSPGYTPAYAKFYQVQHQYQKAIDLLDDYLKIVPRDVDARIALIQCYRQSGDEAQASRSQAELVDAYPDDARVATLEH